MSTNNTPRTSRTRPILLLILAVGISLAMVWFTYRYQQELRDLGSASLVGLFVVSLVGNATLIFPAPSFAAACAMGLVLHPVLVGSVAGLGATMGELTGYLAGYVGKTVLPAGKLYERLHAFMKRHGMLTIFLLAAIPNPIFDVGGIIAGILKMPVWKFLIAAIIGKSIRLGVTAWACMAGIPWLQEIFK